MKRAQYTKLLCSAGLVLHMTAAGAVTIDESFDYVSNPTNGQWGLWTKTAGTVCTAGTPVWDSVNENYVIEAELPSTCGYVYYRMNLPHALDGTTSVVADIKVEVTSGIASDARVALGHGVDYPGFGATGRSVSAFDYSTATSGWQTLGGDLQTPLDAARLSIQRTIALSETSELLNKTEGPVIFLINRTVGGATPRSINLRVTVDNVRVQHDGRSYSDLLTAAATKGSDYSARVNPIFSTLDTDIDAAHALVNGLSLSSRPDVQDQLETESDAILAAHNNNVAVAAARTDTSKKVPTQAEYEQDIARLQTLNDLVLLHDFVANGGDGLVYYPWDATGRKKLNDISLAVGANMLDTTTALFALNELEPIAVVLQNLNDAAVTISDVQPGVFTNQFGEVFPNANIDVRVVKNWYAGSDRGITLMPDKVRVPELLLKDDALVQVDTLAKSNELRISVGGVSSYQDISSPTAKMPNNAVVADATTLQSFSVDTLQAKQLWLTIDTRTDAKAGDYVGDVVVSYQIAGDSTPRTLLVPVQFGVMPVVLQKSDLLYGIYYRGKIDATKASLSSEYKTEAQYLVEMANMLEHGVDHPTQYLGTGSTGLSDAAYYVGLREGLGMPCDKYFFLNGIGGISYNTTTQVTQNVEDLLDMLEGSSCTDPQLYIYGQDEAQGAALLAERDHLTAARNAGAKTYVAGTVGTYAGIANYLDTLVFSGRPNDAEIDLWRQDGKDVYSYSNPQTGVPDPYVYRANYGFLLWQHNYTGAMDYAYQDAFPGYSNSRKPLSDCVTSTTHYCSIWNDFDSGDLYDHVFTYPTTTGVIDTIQWEGFREAIDDTRYLATLQTAIQASGNTTLVALLEGVLEDLKGTANLNPADTRFSIQYALALLNQAPTFSNVQLFTGADEVYVMGEANDPEGFLAKVTVSIDGGAEQEVSRDGAWDHLFSGLADGPHTVHYIATDYWGYTTEDEQVIEVDTLSPGC